METTAEGIRPRVIEKKGPIALILTTTAVGLHKENETRLFSIPVTDTREQTKAIFRAQVDQTEAARNATSRGTPCRRCWPPPVTKSRSPSETCSRN